ncbi:MAG: DUF4071 domain-containing protein [Desulfobacterium sp.]|nr:DUF4071 domain-containing protein [Desulfobacterium sp.]
MTNPPRPLCFVAMPFGRKRIEPGGPEIDFDPIYKAIQAGVEKSGIDCNRADFDPNGGFIHRSMYEALMVAEFVIADMTLANPNVAYEIGVRHGAGQSNTLLVCAEASTKQLPFDFGPLRHLSYSLQTDCSLTDEAADQLSEAIRDRIERLLEDDPLQDNPILQVTGISATVSHEKTDLFVKRLEFAGEMGEKVRQALNLAEPAAAVAELDRLQEKILKQPNVVAQLHTALIAVYLGYREKKAYNKMVALYAALPRELKHATMVLEQLALAQNRLAEDAEKNTDLDKAAALRKEALYQLKRIPTGETTSETFGIQGRIYKGQYDASMKKGEQILAEGALDKAITAYENGLLDDPRDYYPGVNAITLRVIRGTPEDENRLSQIIPVVNFALERLPDPTTAQEGYWRNATRFELACAERDWDLARKNLASLLTLPAEPWMRETTMGNLNLQKETRKDETETVATLEGYFAALKPGKQ